MSAPAAISLAPGLYDGIAAADYHADPCPAPSLSSLIANVICSSSARHAWAQHPRLNPDYAPEHEEKFDLGTVAHAILLEGADIVTPIDAADYRTNAAKDARDAARAAGRVPLLTKHLVTVNQMVLAANTQLDAHQDGRAMFRDGKAEQTLVWQEPDFGGIWCRARLDYLRGATIDDLKTTSASANPEQWTRTLYSIGADVQTAFYLRGLKAVTGLDATMRYAVIETEPPYALSVVALGPAAMTLAEKKVLWALEQWQRCTERDEWPAYPTRTCYADLPQWEESRWLQKEGGL